MNQGGTMGLSKQYDEFYQSELKKEFFSEIVLDKWPRHRVMTRPTDILPALTWLSLVGLLLSRAQLRFTKHRVVYGR